MSGAEMITRNRERTYIFWVVCSQNSSSRAKDLQENSWSSMTRFFRNCNWDKSAGEALLLKSNLEKEIVSLQILKKKKGNSRCISNSECV